MKEEDIVSKAAYLLFYKRRTAHTSTVYQPDHWLHSVAKIKFIEPQTRHSQSQEDLLDGKDCIFTGNGKDRTLHGHCRDRDNYTQEKGRCYLGHSDKFRFSHKTDLMNGKDSTNYRLCDTKREYRNEDVYSQHKVSQRIGVGMFHGHLDLSCKDLLHGKTCDICGFKVKEKYATEHTYCWYRGNERVEKRIFQDHRDRRIRHSEKGTYSMRKDTCNIWNNSVQRQEQRGSNSWPETGSGEIGTVHRGAISLGKELTFL